MSILMRIALWSFVIKNVTEMVLRDGTNVSSIQRIQYVNDEHADTIEEHSAHSLSEFNKMFFVVKNYRNRM